MSHQPPALLSLSLASDPTSRVLVPVSAVNLIEPRNSGPGEGSTLWLGSQGPVRVTESVAQIAAMVNGPSAAAAGPAEPMSSVISFIIEDARALLSFDARYPRSAAEPEPEHVRMARAVVWLADHRTPMEG
jgi:hypothetical protein